MTRMSQTAPETSTAARPGLGRRSLLAGMVAAAGTVAMGGARAAEKHDRHAHRAGATALVGALQACPTQGDICTSHCLDAFADGDISLAACARKVREMTSICQAMAVHAAAGSDYVTALGALCARVCRDCEQACREHGDHHAACRDCAEACVAAIAAIEKHAA